MGKKKYLIDTNITIYYFGLVLNQESVEFLENVFKSKYYISVINRIELLGTKNLTARQSKALESFINNAIIFNLEEKIVVKTIELRRNYNIKLPDAIIAATCLINECSLITNNQKDFNKIDGLDILPLGMNA